MVTRKGFAIILLGIDGSGKTTQSDLLVKFARSKNISISYFWLRVPKKYLYPLDVLNRICGITRKIQLDDGSIYTETQFWRSKFLANLWIRWVGLIVGLIFKNKILKKINEGNVVIIDRYVFDIMVDFAIGTQNDSAIDEIWNKFINLVPKNSKIFYLDVPVEVSWQRKKGEKKSIIKKRKELYNKIVTKCNILVIDGTKDLNIINNEILKICDL